MWGLTTIQFGILLIFLKKSKSFCLIHSKEINHPAGSSLNKRVLKALDKADFVIANSKFTKELALKLGVKDVTVINPGCNYPIVVNERSKEFSKNIFGIKNNFEYNSSFYGEEKIAGFHIQYFSFMIIFDKYF